MSAWVDRLSRKVHSISSQIEDTAADCEKTFFENFYKTWCGRPLLSNRDPELTCKFWKELMNLCGVQLRMCTDHQSQSDGLSEVMSRMAESYIRIYCDLDQKTWNSILPVAELAHNSAVSDDRGLSIFKMNLDWKTKPALEVVKSSMIVNESRKQPTLGLAELLKEAQLSHETAKAEQSAHNAFSQTHAFPKLFTWSMIYRARHSRKISLQNYCQKPSTCLGSTESVSIL